MRRIFGGKVQILDSNGAPVVGGKLEFFDTGTANQRDTFSDYALTSANANPVITDSGGWVEIFLTPNVLYDYTAVDANDVTIYAKITNISTYESKLTTKGDLHAYDTDDQRLAVGADGTFLKADSAQATGIGWGTAGTDTTLTTKGDLYSYDTANARLPVGNDGAILLADSGETPGLKWVNTNLTVTNNATVALTADTWVTITYDTESEDTDNLHNTTTYTTTIAVAGWYSAFIEATVVGANINRLNARFEWTPNGASLLYIPLILSTTPVSVSNDDISMGTIMYLGASDKIIVQMGYSTTNETLSAGSTYRLRRMA